MLQEPVLVFGRATDDLHLSPRMDVLASPEDLVDAWGPGSFVVSLTAGAERNIVQIMIGGGTIEAHDDNFHWSPNLLLDAASTPKMSLTKKVLIGATTERQQGMPVD